MGAGNVRTFGDFEGLFYVNYDLLRVYSRQLPDNKMGDEYEIKLLRNLTDDENENEYVFDEAETDFKIQGFKSELVESIRKRFPSFEIVDKWISNTRKAILENGLFYIVEEDNQWSMAIELIQKRSEYTGEYQYGLQAGLYKKYLKGIEEILLDLNGEVSLYAGAWTSKTVKKENYYEA